MDSDSLLCSLSIYILLYSYDAGCVRANVKLKDFFGIIVVR